METRNYLDIAPLLGEFRNHLRITSHDLDGILMQSLKSAVGSAEHEISMVIAESSFTLSSPLSSSIELRWPVQSVSAVRVDGETLASEDYSVDGNVVNLFQSEGTTVEVDYTAGLSQIPEDMKSAIFLLGASLFNNPTDRPEERDRTTARNLLRPYRSWGEH